MKRFALAAAASLLMLSSAFADTTVKWLHLETNPAAVELMTSAAKEYEAANPGIHIELQFLENEAYKAKLTTLLQSPDSPDIIYSWGGGVLDEQVKAGVLRPIDSVVSDYEKKAIGQAGVNAFSRDSKLYGIAQHVSEVGLWYNKKLLAQAGVDPASLSTWDGLIAGVKKLQAAKITPIAMGGGDKWPAHFFWSELVVRLAGQAQFDAARSGQGEGFGAAPFLEASKKFLELSALHPYQDGFQTAGQDQAAGTFGDGKAALFLMGNWAYNNQQVQAADKKGLPDADLGMLPFPSVNGGAGNPTDTLGGLEGWIFSKNASDESVKFMQWYESKDYMSKAAKQGLFIPINADAASAIENPFLRVVAQNVSHAHWHALFFDQVLGPSVGGVVNDVSAALADNKLTAEDATAQIKQAVDDNK